MGALILGLAALSLAGRVSAHLEFGNYKLTQLAEEISSWLVLGEWGGQSAPPYTTPGQLAAAEAMATVATTSLSKFIVSPGGNFYDNGIQGSTESTVAQTRLADTWQAVYNTPYPATLAELPWYTVAGAVDWEGNVTAEIGFNGTNSGQWIQPDLFYTFQTVVPFSGDTIEFIMIDTESLIGGVNPTPGSLPSLFYPPPAPEAFAYTPYASGATAAAPSALLAAAKAAAATAAAAPAAAAAAAAAMPAAAAPMAATVAPATAYASAGPAAAPTAGASAAAPASAPTYSAAAASGVYGRRRLSQIANLAVDTGALDSTAGAGYLNPTVNAAQWTWVETAINSSYADWIIVVGNHPVWSAGEWGPTWLLADRLGPIMEAAGVALYIGAKDHQLAHFQPVPATNNVDYLVVGAGAVANSTDESANEHAAECPYGGLAFQYYSGTGFAQMQVSHSEANVPGLLKVDFYDSAGAVLYSFYKENPRTVAGHVVGNLGAPPGPSPLNANADAGGPMVIISGMFIVLAVSMGLWIIASHAMTTMGYRGARANAYVGMSETTPLMSGGKAGMNL